MLGDLLDVPPPAVDAALAGRLARDLFGVEGAVTPLGGERDRNFRIASPDEGDWVLKVVHPREDPAVTDLQSVVLERLRTRSPGLPVPRVRRPLAGADPTATWTDPSGAAGTEPLRVRMYSYLAGVPVSRGPLGPELARGVGTLVGELDLALAELSHPGQEQDLAWDAHRVRRVEPLVPDLPAEDRPAVQWALDRMMDHADPIVTGLRRQVIHNDANLDNLLTRAVGDAEVVGLIDFGDMLRGPLVQDAATAAAYQLRDGGHPMAGPADVLEGYQQRIRLEPEEIEVFVDLVAARWVLTTTITDWRARQQPDNRDYIVRNSAAARSGLHRLRELGWAAADRYVRERVGAAA